MADSEKLIELKGHLGYQREDMPQIDPIHIGHFIAWLSEKYQVTCNPPAMVRVDNILPSQQFVHKDKVEKKWQEIIDNGLGPVMKTLIISKDNRQLDGHNTVQAIKRNLGGNVVLPYIFVDESMEVLVNLARRYPYTTYKGIDDIS